MDTKIFWYHRAHHPKLLNWKEGGHRNDGTVVGLSVVAHDLYGPIHFIHDYW